RDGNHFVRGGHPPSSVGRRRRKPPPFRWSPSRRPDWPTRNRRPRPHHLALRADRPGLSPASAAGVCPLAVQLDRSPVGPSRHFFLLPAGHRRRLSPPADPPQLSRSEMAGARVRGPRRLLLAGFAGPLGGGPSAAPSALRPPARSAQSAGELVLGPRGLA